MKKKDFSYEILSFMRTRNLTNKKAADYFGVSTKTLSDWKNGSRQPGYQKTERVYDMITNYPFGDNPVPRFSFDEIIESNDQRLLLIATQSLLNCAYDLAIEGAQAATLASYKPYITLTSALRIPHKNKDDMPYAEDYFASEAIKTALRKYLTYSKHLLSYGVMMYDEESGLDEVQGVNNSKEVQVSPNLILFIDPLDGSYFWGGQRRIFGCTVVSFYHLELGYLCSVCVDISARQVYLKMRGLPASAHSLFFSSDPADDKTQEDLKFIRGTSLPLVSSDITSPTKDVVLNIYRITQSRERVYRPIVDKIYNSFAPKFIHSISGAGGVCLTALGGMTACIEIAPNFGFRPWDFVGAFICSDNCFVCDENGNQIDFNSYRIKNEYIFSGFSGDHMEKCRQKFIVAGTEELGKRLLDLLI